MVNDRVERRGLADLLLVVVMLIRRFSSNNSLYISLKLVVPLDIRTDFGFLTFRNDDVGLLVTLPRLL